jgi:hypothetical protein
MKPIKRSALRIMLGKIVYRMKRYVEWYFGRIKFAKLYDHSLLPYHVFKHQTPLLRQLKDVEMWLQYNKIKNLEIAIKRLNGIVVYPGETFSYWRLLGKPTKSPYSTIWKWCNLLHVYLTDSQLVGEWRSVHAPIHTYEIYEKEHKINLEQWGGYVRHNLIYRRVYNLQQDLIDDEYITENHAIMTYQPFLSESTGSSQS